MSLALSGRIVDENFDTNVYIVPSWTLLSEMDKAKRSFKKVQQAMFKSLLKIENYKHFKRLERHLV